MELTRVAIIGGGLGGLMTALLLQRQAPGRCEVTIYEASDRLGGKVITKQFQSAPVIYEAGAAELYDYSGSGPDPLREMIAEFGLPTRPIDGRTIVLGNRILTTEADIRRELGASACDALRRFKARAREIISPAEYYESDWQADNMDPMSRRRFRELLAQIGNDNARRYIEVQVHSDLATEPHLTNAMYGLQNYLMNYEEYMRLYTIDGGIERLPRELAARIDAAVMLEHRVTRVQKTDRGSYRVVARHQGEESEDTFDYVVVALPNNWIPMISWEGPLLSEAMHQHHVFYDSAAHYLRVTILFDKPFWRSQINESYFMLDAFGGCCVYDESSRVPGCGYGVLGWLLAGAGAMAMSSCDDHTLIDAVLDSLPRSLRHGRQLFREGHVHRWIGTVSGLPGGYPARDPDSRHQPEPQEHQELFVVGDYLFDSTINGVLDSAATVAEWIAEDLAEEELPIQVPAEITSTEAVG